MDAIPDPDRITLVPSAVSISGGQKKKECLDNQNEKGPTLWQAKVYIYPCMNSRYHPKRMIVSQFFVSNNSCKSLLMTKTWSFGYNKTINYHINRPYFN